jgi:hypothetical protein
MRRLIKGLALALIPVATIATLAGSASASGTTAVSKGDVQAALHWNNGDFDKNAPNVTFASDTISYGYSYVWVDTNGVQHTTVMTDTKTFAPGSFQDAAKQVLSGNGKQITGWNVSVSGVGSPTAEAFTYTVDGVPTQTPFMTPDGVFIDWSQPYTSAFTPQAFNVKVNGTVLPVTIPV